MVRTLLASGVRTSSDQTVLVGSFEDVMAGVFYLDVTAAAAAAGDTLDVYVQSAVDTSGGWNDFIHFTQVLGNGGAKQYIATWQPLGTAETDVIAPQNGAISPGVVQNVQAFTWKVKWVIVNAGAGAQSFTFSLKAELIRRERR
jgi:hypothetical protein